MSLASSTTPSQPTPGGKYPFLTPGGSYCIRGEEILRAFFHAGADAARRGCKLSAKSISASSAVALEV
eukprot:CAMPEP_0169161512 /NCGR_PEP_ID=MMETSP1015-20121227/57087_1 /TAXON_ID=342587 /ORGANISM="Karlodinium micrum, Strain CCMP2283" /LENGTH=67 /DNA_ID=CAMNT_0009233379 /DNA_START=219 /DNA_END=422 /DNA_ORIENTATION=-